MLLSHNPSKKKILSFKPEIQGDEKNIYIYICMVSSHCKM